ncbi:MAG: hypothetical protein N3C61_00530 [Candidatus Micrarchaeota archaeon]|nr:hypothetical protein [Candidatus Micrarchaeota archaeon]
MVEFIVMIFLGYFLRNILDPKTVFNLLYYIILPSAIVLQFSSFELDMDLLIFPITYIISTILTIHIIEFLSKRMMKLSDPIIGAIILTIPVVNAGSVFAVSSYLFGSEGLIKSSIYIIGYAFVIPYTILIVNRYSIKQDSIQELFLRNIIGSPIFLSILAGILINVYGIQIPSIINRILEYISYSLIPISMISLGIGIDKSRILDSRILVIIMLKILIGIMLIYILSQIVPLSRTDIMILLVANLSPLGFFGPMMSSRMGFDVGFTSNLVVVSIGLFSLFSGILSLMEVMTE